MTVPSDAVTCRCGEKVAAASAALGVEVHVQPCPPMVVEDPAFPPFYATCPHGVTWMAEPTGEQRAEWVRLETP